MIKWAEEGKYDKIIPLIGGFHTLSIKPKIKLNVHSPSEFCICGHPNYATLCNILTLHFLLCVFLTVKLGKILE